MPVSPATLVLAHGFTQSAASFGPFAELVAGGGRSVVAVDLAGHGRHRATRADLPGAARLLLDDAGAADAPVDLLGYSMGARIALRAALDQPEQVRSLVLLSGTPGIEDPGARATRQARDHARADELEASGDLEGFLRAWLAQPMFARLGPGADQWSARIVNTTTGLASSLRLVGTGTQEPLWERLGALGCPTLAVAGAADTRFAAIATAMARRAANATCSLVPGAGHAVHLEQPATTARLVTTWLDTHG